jgi:hypothetical protein
MALRGAVYLELTKYDWVQLTYVRRIHDKIMGTFVCQSELLDLPVDV